MVMWFSPFVPLILFFLGKLFSWSPNIQASNSSKRSPYECGFSAFMSPRSSFSIYFFLVAILFLVFDAELVLLMPLPLIFSIHSYSVMSMFFFIVILTAGLYHEWREGSLDWPMG